jgi:Ca2+-binding RTX toxin-like protein
VTGGSGNDTLVGFAGGYDKFQDTASGLKGDTISNFVSTDRIDVTDLIPGSATLTAPASGPKTIIAVSSGATKASHLMDGSFTRSGFTLSSDGAGGTIIAHS